MTVLSRYLELSERPRYRLIAEICFLSIALQKTTFPDRKIKKPRRAFFKLLCKESDPQVRNAGHVQLGTVTKETVEHLASTGKDD